MTKLAILAMLLVACAADPAPEPALTFELRTIDPADSDADAYSRAARAWRDVGAFEVEGAELVLWIDRYPHLREEVGSNGVRQGNHLTIDARVTGRELLVVAAHEVGHAILDTSRHTSGCGVMGGSDVLLCEEDYIIACEEAGLCDRY